MCICVYTIINLLTVIKLKNNNMFNVEIVNVPNIIPVEKILKFTQQNLKCNENIKTHSGYSIDTLKWVLRNYVNRGIWDDKGAWIVREIHLLNILEQNKRPCTRAVISDISNFILTIAINDISPREYKVVCFIFNHMLEYRSIKDPTILAKVLYFLCIAQKSQVCYYLHSYVKEYKFSTYITQENLTVSLSRITQILRRHKNLDVVNHRLIMAEYLYIVYSKICDEYKKGIGMSINSKFKFVRWIRKSLIPNCNELYLTQSINHKLDLFLKKRHFFEEFIVLISIYDTYLASLFSYDCPTNPKNYKFTFIDKETFVWNNHYNITQLLSSYDDDIEINNVDTQWTDDLIKKIMNDNTTEKKIQPELLNTLNL